MANSRKEDPPVSWNSIQAASATSDGKTDSKTTASASAQTTFYYVDVHIATPYGVTNHLEIPVADGGSPADKKTGLTWGQDTVELVYTYSGSGIVSPSPVQAKPVPLTIKWDTKTLGTPTFLNYDLQLTFAKPYGDAKVPAIQNFDESAITVSIAAPITFDTKKGLLTVPPEAIATGAFMKFGSVFGPKNMNPPVPVIISKATLVGKNGTAAVAQTDISGTLTVTWQDVSLATSTGPTLVLPPALPSPLPCNNPVLPMPLRHGQVIIMPEAKTPEVKKDPIPAKKAE